ncbi:MAG: nucleotidyltransferase domain-containing protein [Methanoregula sp.]|jgi:predicted nucleotidyltransferase
MKSEKIKPQHDMDEIIRRIVEVARPEQVILFGSAARGTTTPHSDLDFLVVKSGRYNSRTVAGEIYLRMRGIVTAIDLVIVTPKQVEEYRNSPFSVIYPALREGKVVYEKKSGRRITPRKDPTVRRGADQMIRNTRIQTVEIG